MINLPIIIITGCSGSGKSTAIGVLEDAGFYCVDNMPVALLPKFMELPIENAYDVAGLAFVMDLRERGFLDDYPAVFKSLRQKGYPFKIIFLKTAESVLLQRFSQTRRHHPLAKDRSLLESIRAEKTRLEDIKKNADIVIDTTPYTVHTLKAALLELIQQSKTTADMKIDVMSFGFKYGAPPEADLIIDVRFMVNPYFVTQLKELTGKDPAVKAYIFKDHRTHTFLKKYDDLLDYLIPLYEKEGKAYLTIAVGCTGGRHRSVAIAQAIFEHVNTAERRVNLRHRDIER